MIVLGMECVLRFEWQVESIGFYRWRGREYARGELLNTSEGEEQLRDLYRIYPVIKMWVLGRYDMPLQTYINKLGRRDE